MTAGQVMRCGRLFLNCVVLLFALTASSRGQEPPAAPKSYIYKTVGTHDIRADVYAGEAAGPRPVVVWIHGGALIMGHRGQVERPLRDKLLQAGYVVVSIDYRLAPETKLPAILDD